ncbi:transposase [Klebsiella pneumoniae]|uniref:transposase n=1 Tax=Klebsiella pneumoniae TaxID=573 RepID=UPI002974202F|nr:transposase [Klebsiella pneumoniae]
MLVSRHSRCDGRSHQRDKLERFCRYINRPCGFSKTSGINRQWAGALRAQNSVCNGTTHVIFEPLDFIAKLAALVPKPRVNLARFHGVFAPNSKHRVQVTPAKRGKKPDKSEGLDTNWRTRVLQSATAP